jgi:hypothetical protein
MLCWLLSDSFWHGALSLERGDGLIGPSLRQEKSLNTEVQREPPEGVGFCWLGTVAKPSFD